MIVRLRNGMTLVGKFGENRSTHIVLTPVGDDSNEPAAIRIEKRDIRAMTIKKGL